MKLAVNDLAASPLHVDGKARVAESDLLLDRE
jgi:hypothetical protein